MTTKWGENCLPVVDTCTHRIEDSTGSCTEKRLVSHTWTAYWAGKLVVSSVKPSDDAKKKKKVLRFTSCLYSKYIFSVSDPFLFYWVESLELKVFRKNNVAFPYVSGNTFNGNLSYCLWTNPLFIDINKVFFSSCGILYKNTSDVLDVTDFNKSY